MAKCSVCGKKGLFLRVNSFGRCKTCEEEFQKEEKRKKEEKCKKEEERKKEEKRKKEERIVLEKICLERQEKEGTSPISLHSYVVTDIETSGLDHNISAIIEISAIKVLNGEVIEEYTSLIHSERTLSSQITGLTGITTDMIRSCSKSLETVMREYREFVGDYPLIGHNISKFDICFIDKAYKTVFGASVQNKCVDTLPLAREYIRDSQNYKLQTLAEHLNLPVKNAHRALSDCKTTLELYKAICRIAKEKDIEHEKLLAEANDPNSEIGWIIQTMKNIFSGINCSYLRYTKYKSYVRFKCFYDIFRIKASGRIKNYIVFAAPFEKDVLKSVNLKTTKATSSDGGGTTRIFFNSVDELLFLKDIILNAYLKQKQYVEESIELERKLHNDNGSSNGIIRIVWDEGEEPHYEKSVERYLNDKELLRL